MCYIFGDRMFGVYIFYKIIILIMLLFDWKKKNYFLMRFVSKKMILKFNIKFFLLVY